ncbi:MAG TPA: hypothetical protein VLG92_00725 [Candidatus Saccharimonadia bacterium]|nr:hypothetical protein [Candidatus Saccharimonadia bacterium]
MDLIASEYKGKIDQPTELFAQPTEEERFATLKALDFSVYKAALVSFHNEVVADPDGAHWTFTDRRIVADNPNSGELIRYPEVPYKSAVLEYAHTQSQESGSLERAAFIEGAAIYLTQPFMDHNKATARNVYLALRGGWLRSERVNSDLLHSTPATKAEGKYFWQEDWAMNTINFSDAFLTPEVAKLVDDQVYAGTSITKVGGTLRLHNPEETDQAAYEKTMATLNDKLTADDKKELLSLLGKTDDREIFTGADFDASGLQYGLSVLASQGLYRPTPEKEGEEQQTVIQEALAQLSPEALKGLISHTWDYHTQQALASIDLLAQDITIQDPHRGKITTYDFIRERSAHFEASRVDRKYGALALQAYQTPILERQKQQADKTS